MEKKMKTYEEMKAKELHLNMKLKGVWIKNAQFLKSVDKLILLNEGLDSPQGKEIIANLKERMKEMRKRQSKHISATKLKPKKKALELPSDSEMIDEDVPGGKIVRIDEYKTWDDESKELEKEKSLPEEKKEPQGKKEDWFDDVANSDKLDDLTEFAEDESEDDNWLDDDDPVEI